MSITGPIFHDAGKAKRHIEASRWGLSGSTYLIEKRGFRGRAMAMLRRKKPAGPFRYFKYRPKSSVLRF